jgi:hypothetical protein
MIRIISRPVIPHFQPYPNRNPSASWPGSLALPAILILDGISSYNVISSLNANGSYDGTSRGRVDVIGRGGEIGNGSPNVTRRGSEIGSPALSVNEIENTPYVNGSGGFNGIGNGDVIGLDGDRAAGPSINIFSVERAWKSGRLCWI